MIKLNKEQQEFVDSIVKFWEGDTFEMTLSGAAGTGKTTTLKSAIKEMKKNHIPYLMAATTNAAVVRMNECNGENEQPAITIHKTIYDINQETGEIMEHVTGLGDYEQFKNGIVIVDEASMLSGKDMKILRKMAKNFACKIIYVGDAEQLPPVEKKRR